MFKTIKQKYFLLIELLTYYNTNVLILDNIDYYGL